MPLSHVYTTGGAPWTDINEAEITSDALSTVGHAIISTIVFTAISRYSTMGRIHLSMLGIGHRQPLSIKRKLSLLAAVCLSTSVFAVHGASAAAESQAKNAASTTTTLTQAAEPVKDKWAVIVGISKFNKSSLNLKFAAKDAEDFRNFLIDRCHFAPDHIKLLTDDKATKNRILDVMGDSWLPRVALPDDLVVIFFSSHGSPSDMDIAGSNYVVAHDTNPDKLYTTGISIQDLADVIKKRVHSNRVLIILDACHSGGASDASKGLARSGNVDASAMAQGTGHVVICSSTKNESSWESKTYQNGVFTHTLMEALQSKGEATKLSDAFGYLKDNVQQQVASERGVMQTPVLEASKWQGSDLLLGVKPTNPRKAPLIEIDEDNSSPPQVVASASSAGSSTRSIANEASAKASAGIPDISGDWVGTNSLHYKYWQKGKNCGWQMPQFGVVGKGEISDDGKSLSCSWTGIVNGNNTAVLEVDDNNRVVKMTSSEGFIFTRPAGK